MARVAQRRLRLPVPSRGARPRAADVRRAVEGARRGRGAGAVPARPGGSVPERVGDRLSRSAGDPARRDVEGHAGDHRGRRPGAAQRRADPHRRGGDDQVPARLRSGGVQDAGREHADDRAHAAVRVWRARLARRPDRLARRGGADLGGKPLRARDPLARVCRRTYRGRDFDGRAGRGDWRRFELRRPEKQAARDVARRIAARRATTPVVL